MPLHSITRIGIATQDIPGDTVEEALENAKDVLFREHESEYYPAGHAFAGELPDWVQQMMDGNWRASEKGNTLLVHGDNPANMVAWIKLHDDLFMEIEYVVDNYPALAVNVRHTTEDDLRDHINKNCQSYIAKGCKISGVTLEDD